MNEHKLEEWIANKLNINGNLTKSHIENQQLINLNNTLHIAKKSLFYREYLKDIGELKSLDDIVDIPFIDGSHIKKYHNKMVAVSQGDISKIVTMNTSGTTGESKRIYFTDNDLESIIDFFHHGLSQFIKKDTKTLILMPSRVENSIGDLVSKGIERIGGESIKYGLLDDFDNVYNELKNCKYIIGMPMQIFILGRYLKYVNLEYNIEGILLSADNGSRKIFNEIEELYNCKIYNHYGITEGGLGVAVECNHHSGMHPRELDIYLEIIDDNGKVVKDGEYGEIVLTTLTREAMPIIRYKTGDISRFLIGKCPCNSPFKRLDNIIGRKNDIEKINLNDLDDLLYNFKSLLDYRLELEKYSGRIILQFLPFNTPKEEDIINILNVFNLNNIEIIIDISEKYKNLHKGKRKIYYMD